MDLSSVEWHDLPLASLSIAGETVELIVTPYDEATRGYVSYKLTISGFADLHLDIQGVISLHDLSNLEVASFDWRSEPDHQISGSIGILPASQGYWTVGFTRAAYRLTRIG